MLANDTITTATATATTTTTATTTNNVGRVAKLRDLFEFLLVTVTELKHLVVAAHLG